MWSKIHNVWGHLRTIEFGRQILDSSGIFHIYIIIRFFFSVLKLTYNYTLVRSSYNHASASTTMDRVPAVPDLHTDIWRDCSPAHQLGLWTHCLQDVPQQVAPQGLSFWPDGHQHRHRAATCQHGPVAACGRPGKNHACVGTFVFGNSLPNISRWLDEQGACVAAGLGWRISAHGCVWLMQQLKIIIILLWLWCFL